MKKRRRTGTDPESGAAEACTQFPNLVVQRNTLIPTENADFPPGFCYSRNRSFFSRLPKALAMLTVFVYNMHIIL